MKKTICFFLFFYVLVTQAQVDVTNNGTLYIGSNTDIFSANGNFTNASSASLTNNGKMYMKQNFTNNQSATPVGTGELIMDGIVTQYLSTTSNSPLYKLTINKASGLATLSSAVTINNTLSLSAGKLSISNYDLTIANSASITGAGTDKYVMATGTGVLKQQVAGNDSKLFPVGLASAYTPVTVSLSLLSTTDVFHVRMLPAVYANGTSGSVMNSNAVNATWMVSEAVNGGSNATLTVQWPGSLELTGFNRIFSRLAHFSPLSWDYGLLNIIATGTNPYSVSRAGFTSFSPFAVSMLMAILPAGELELTAKNKGEDNIVSWSATSEVNCSHYTVEASLNGVDFTEVGRVNATGNTNSSTAYNFVHHGVSSNSYYYRIKQADLDGKSAYSKIVRVNMAAFAAATLYPNPVKDKTTISFTLLQSSFVEVNVLNAAGSVVHTTNQRFTKGEQQLTLDLNRLLPGTYILQLKDEMNHVQSFRFIKIN
nr:T9SS type A sorting domain-containing protein [uncultured Lacibacter sp.]